MQVVQIYKQYPPPTRPEAIEPGLGSLSCAHVHDHHFSLPLHTQAARINTQIQGQGSQASTKTAELQNFDLADVF
jgi:hypothetical protein